MNRFPWHHVIVAIGLGILLAVMGTATSADPAASAADAAPPPSATSAGMGGHWEGSISLPGAGLDIMVDLTSTGEDWSGTIDIPMQGAKGLPLAGIAVSGDEVRFSIADIPGSPSFAGSLADGAIKGSFTQGGQSFPFSLGRERKAQMPHPQEPKGPFPYVSEDVSYSSGDVELAGTLTIPAGKGPFPAVLLISGSGAQDRNEELFGHKPFWVLADFLTRAGIAVLRVDDRGVGGSTGDLSTVTTEDLARDALAGLDFLKRRTEIDGKKIGMAGHSEGGLVAPLAAKQSSDVAFLVLLSAPGVPGDSILTRQLQLSYDAAGLNKDRTRLAVLEQRKFFLLIKQSADSAALAEQSRKMIRAQYGAQNGAPEIPAAQLEQVVQVAVQQAQSPWLRYFIAYDPRPTLRTVRVPVLVLAGEKDLQVNPDQSVPEIEAALAAAGNKNVTVRRFPGLNHLFQTAKTGTVMEYGQLQETMNPAVLQTVQEWILAQTR